jgi:hypothetical protein
MVYCKYKLNKQETVIVVFPLKQSNLNVGAKNINYLGDIDNQLGWNTQQIKFLKTLFARKYFE